MMENAGLAPQDSFFLTLFPFPPFCSSSLNAGTKLPVFSSSITLFVYIKTAIKRCTALTTSATFFILAKEFKVRPPGGGQRLEWIGIWAAHFWGAGRGLGKMRGIGRFWRSDFRRFALLPFSSFFSCFSPSGLLVILCQSPPGEAPTGQSFFVLVLLFLIRRQLL